MLGTITNSLTIVIGCLIGLVAKNKITEISGK